MKTQLSDLHYTFYELFKWTFRTRGTFSFPDSTSHVAHDDTSIQAFVLRTKLFRVVTEDQSRLRIQHDAMSNMVLPLYVQWLE
eukprot:4280131-Amphidinium_carterae.1